MGMRYSRFILLDALGVLISVPASIYLGKVFGGSVDRLKETVHDIHLILAFLALSLILILVFRRKRRPAKTAPKGRIPSPAEEKSDPPENGSKPGGRTPTGG